MRKATPPRFRKNPTPTIQSRVDPALRRRFRKDIANLASKTRTLTPKQAAEIATRFSFYEQPLSDFAIEARKLVAQQKNFHGGVGYAEIIRDTILIWACGIGLTSMEELVDLGCNWERIVFNGYSAHQEEFIRGVAVDLQHMVIGRDEIKKGLLAKDHSGFGIHDVMRFLRLHCMEGERYYIGRIPAEFALNRFANLVADQLG